MATTKSLSLTDIFPTASYDSSADEFTIPLADLADAGLEESEVSGDDGRKIGFAFIRTIADGYVAVKAAFDAIDAAHAAWQGAKAYVTGDKVQVSGVYYTATADHTSHATTFGNDSASWSEETVQAPPDNFTATIRNASYSAGDFGTSTISQKHEFDAVYQGTTDLAAES